MANVIEITAARKVGERREVCLTGLRLDEAVDQTLAALQPAEHLFVRGLSLVRLVRGPKRVRGAEELADAPRIIPLPASSLRELVARHVRVTRRTKDKDDNWTTREVDPSKDHIAAMVSRAEYPMLRPIRGVIEAPALRPDGTVIQGDPGYDAATGLFYAPTASFPTIPDAPTLDDAKSAAAELLDVVKDFPFATDAHRSAWLASLLSLFGRPAIDGPCPIMAIDATTPGTGKGLLVDVTNLIALGRDPAKMPQPDDDNEMRKRIMSLVASAEPVVVLDNVEYALKYPSLEGLLTSTEWQDRALGETAIVGGEARAVWFVTGNNIVFGGDLVRRVLHIRLETTLENPQDREDIEHEDLKAWCRQERGRLVRAALVILRAYFVAGRPKVAQKPWGSFEAWTALVAGALVWVGLPSPIGTQIALAAERDEAKSTLAAMIDLIVRFGGTHGTSVGAMLKKLYPATNEQPDWYTEARETLESVAPLSSGKPNPTKLAAYLRGRVKRLVGGRWIVNGGKNQGAVIWLVEDLREGGAP